MNKMNTARNVWAAVSKMQATGEHVTLRAIGARVGRVPSIVAWHLDKLEGLGYVSRGPARSGGTIRVLVPLITTW